MKYIKTFESWSSSPVKELVNQLGYDFVEEYFDEHLAYDDVDEVIEIYPSIIWNHVDDDRAMKDVISDEVNNLGVEEFSEDDIKKYINRKHVDLEDEEKIFSKYIKNEIDLDELEELKINLNKEEEEEKISIQNEIDDIENKIKEIRELDLSELLDEMDEDTLREIITDIFDEYDFVETIITDRYDRYSLQEYIEEIYGDVDKINVKKDMPWVMNYVDEDAVLKEYNDNESYDYKEERVEDEIYCTPELQEKLLKINPKNSLLLFDLDYSEDNIYDTYNFQKIFIEEYAKNYSDGNEEDMGEGRAIALKELYNKTILDGDIEEEYDDYMYYVHAKKYNL